VADIYWATPKNYKLIFSSQRFQTGYGPTHLSQQWVPWEHFIGMKQLGARLKCSLCRFQGKMNLSFNPRYSHGQFHLYSKITNFLFYIRRIIKTKWKDSWFKTHGRAKDVCCVQLASLLIFLFVYFGVSLPIIVPLLLHATLSLHWQAWVPSMFSEHRLLLTGIKSRI